MHKHLRKTTFLFWYSIVSADPTGSPFFEGFALYLRVAARQVDFPMEIQLPEPRWHIKHRLGCSQDGQWEKSLGLRLPRLLSRNITVDDTA